MTVDATSIRKLVFWPAVVTLAITLLRLTGELLHWSPSLFNPAPGGGGALVGISWLPPVFGIVFAIQLVRAGSGPSSGGRAIGMALLGIAAAAAVIAGARALGVLRPGSFSLLALVVLTTAIAVGAACRLVGMAGPRPDAPRLRVRRPRPRCPGHAHRDAGQLGHALRRGASRVPGDGRVLEVAPDRRATAAHHVDRVHGAGGRADGVDRGSGRVASSGADEARRGLIHP